MQHGLVKNQVRLHKVEEEEDQDQTEDQEEEQKRKIDHERINVVESVDHKYF